MAVVAVPHAFQHQADYLEQAHRTQSAYHCRDVRDDVEVVGVGDGIGGTGSVTGNTAQR